MAAVKGKNTKPEIAIRKLLHAQGYRFRLHRKGSPRHARHRAAEIQNRHLHQRLFLAPTRGLQARRPTLHAPRLLASQTRRQQTTRRPQPRCPPRSRLHHPHHLGMRDKDHPRHPHHPQPPAKGSIHPCPRLLSPPRHRTHGSRNLRVLLYRTFDLI